MARSSVAIRVAGRGWCHPAVVWHVLHGSAWRKRSSFPSRCLSNAADVVCGESIVGSVMVVDRGGDGVMA